MSSSSLMRRVLGPILLVVIMTIGQTNPSFLVEPSLVKSAPSALSLDFSNGPQANDTVKGLYTLSIGSSGTGNLSSMVIEISNDDSNWAQIANLSSTPWITYFDSTSFENGSWNLRVNAYDDDVSNNTTWFSSGFFDIANHDPIISTFTLGNSGAGSGENAIDRKWFSIEANGTLEFDYTVDDDDFSYATLTNAPGPSSPINDGPSNLAYGWDWASGNLAEGTYNARLTVYDNSGLSAIDTMFIGIDRTAPTMTAPMIGDGSSWTDSTAVVISNLDNSIDDSTGSGGSHVEMKIDGVWTSFNSDSTTLNLAEGEHSILMRPIDIVGNIGDSISVDIKVDTTDPEGLGWTVDELTTSRVGAANVIFAAGDDGSGIDNLESKIQYGFDLNGVGNTPDQSGRWIDIGTSGLNGSIGLSSWATKSRQFLMLRAVITDVAGNSITTIPSAFQILPGIDMSWNASQTNLDRLVARPGDTNGKIVITSVLESNQVWGGTVSASLEAAPADRTADVSWTVMETILLPSGSMSDMSEEIIWNYTIPNTGQFDLRLTIDSDETIDERDEGNNEYYLVVTGASVTGVGVVPSFAPSIGALMVAGFAIAWMQKRKVTPPPK
jgi:hypothetical protein